MSGTKSGSRHRTERTPDSAGGGAPRVPAGGPSEEFLSEEDLDLRNLSDEELVVWWNLWLRMAQGTNDLDEATYEHGVFDRDPAVPVRDAPPRV